MSVLKLEGVSNHFGAIQALEDVSMSLPAGEVLGLMGACTVLGSVVGAALIKVIRNSLIVLGISTFWQGAFVGSFIILAVAFVRLRALRDEPR